MNALAVRPDATSIDSLLPSAHRDGGMFGVALIGAVVLHALALLVPVPEQQAPPPARDFSDPPEITPTWTPPPPPPVPQEPVQAPDEAAAVFVPVELEIPPTRLEPTVAQETIVDDLPTTVPVAVSAFTGEVAPPPAPSIHDQATIGLVLPVALGERLQPVYPAIARLAGREGRVVLLATISGDGAVENIEVLAAPNPDLGFVEAARAAVEAWRYRPGTLQGQPVTVTMTVVVSFELD